MTAFHLHQAARNSTPVQIVAQRKPRTTSWTRDLDRHFCKTPRVGWASPQFPPVPPRIHRIEVCRKHRALLQHRHNSREMAATGLAISPKRKEVLRLENGAAPNVVDGRTCEAQAEELRAQHAPQINVGLAAGAIDDPRIA